MENNAKTVNNKKLLGTIIGIVIIAAMIISGIYLVNMDFGDKTPAFKIETPFAELEYPSAWQENLNIEWSGTDNAGKLIFFARIQDREEEIFAIHFNEEAQIPIGFLNEGKGIKINIGYSLANPQFDESWSNYEKDTFYAMQDDINFLIGQISKDKRFTEE